MARIPDIITPSCELSRLRWLQRWSLVLRPFSRPVDRVRLAAAVCQNDCTVCRPALPRLPGVGPTANSLAIRVLEGQCVPAVWQTESDSASAIPERGLLPARCNADREQANDARTSGLDRELLGWAGKVAVGGSLDRQRDQLIRAPGSSSRNLALC